MPTRILGIDYGLARIGISLSDETKMLAAPYTTLQAEKKCEKTVDKLIVEIDKICQEKGCTIESIVIGLPLMMSGTVGMLADEVRHFTDKLKDKIETPIVLWDERLTSVQADRSLREGGFSRKKRAKKIDSVAAVIILQSYLDSL